MARRCAFMDLELLEERLNPASYGLAWPDPSQLTLSFVPDGTLIDTTPSKLFGSMSKVGSASQWEGAILQAFQTWAAQSNINIAVVPDGGEPLGTPGPLQSDSRFGDIRIAAEPLSAESVALSTPFDPTVGTWSGDVIFNSSQNFTVGKSSGYDLFSVALHEAGHVFGQADNNTPASVMYTNYTGPRTQLAPMDVQALQQLYGVRQPDQFDLQGSNDTFKGATKLNLGNNANNYQAIALYADISSPTDVDIYQFKAAKGSGGITVRLTTNGISLLVPQVTIYDGAQNVLPVSSSIDPASGDLLLRINQAPAAATYYVKVSGLPNSVFGIGTYQIEVRPDAAGNSPANMVGDNGTGLEDSDPDFLFPGAKHLAQRVVVTDARFDYTYQDSLSSSTSANYYRVRSPLANGTNPIVLTVVIWAQRANALDPVVNVYDNRGNLVPAQVDVNEYGTYVLQVLNAKPNSAYYVAVKASDPTNPLNKGKYFLGVDYGFQAMTIQQLKQVTLTNGASESFGALYVFKSQEYHFILSAQSAQANAGTAVRMTIYDSHGNVVGTLVAKNGETQTMTLLLTPGRYIVRFAGAGRSGPLVATTVKLGIITGASEDLSPQLVDTSGDSTDPSADGTDPNAATDGTDPNADPNATTDGTDPNAVPTDPNAAPIDPNAVSTDPNAAPTDPNAATDGTDPNATTDGTDPNAATDGTDPNAPTDAAAPGPSSSDPNSAPPPDVWLPPDSSVPPPDPTTMPVEWVDTSNSYSSMTFSDPYSNPWW